MECGQPGGEPGLQNIRKRKRQRLAAEAAKAAETVQTTTSPTLPLNLPPPAPTPAAPKRKNSEKAPFRLKPAQVDKKHTHDLAAKRPLIEALKVASAEYQRLSSIGASGKHGSTSAHAIAKAYNANLPPDGPQLNGKRILWHVDAGLAGLSPPRMGPKTLSIPDRVVDLMSTHVSMQQLNGNELKPRAIQRSVTALVKGTEFEKFLTSKRQRDQFLLRLRRLGGLVSVGKIVVDNRRWLWLTYHNRNEYFTGWKYFVVTHGFAEDTPEVQPDGSTSEVTFTEWAKLRCSVGDETHQKLSNAGDNGGSRSTTYIDPTIARSGSRKAESQKHITAYIILNASGEVGPFTVIFDTSADDEGDRKLNVAWTASLPRVNAQFGCDDVMTWEPVVLITPKGGTAEDALEKILVQALEPLYPDLAPDWVTDENDSRIGGPVVHRLDGGPGRAGPKSLPMRMRAADKGIILFPSGPQNCTAACQEPDQMFDVYKALGNDITDEIVTERIGARAAAEAALRKGNPERRIDPKKLPKVELTNADLPRIVNGRPDDPIERRPLSFTFSREKVLNAHAKVGAVPLTRAALQNPKVRKELAPADDPAGIPATIAAAHAANMATGEELGLNVAAVQATLPRRWHPVVAPPTDAETIIRKLADAKCSHGAMWINCGAIAFNADVVNRAGCEIAQRELNAKLDSASNKLSTFTELKSDADSILSRMRDEEIVSYDDLAPGEPKVLVRFYFTAKGEAGIAKYSKVGEQTAFLNGLESEALEELLMLDAPIGFKKPEEVESVAAALLNTMSDSVRQTIENKSQNERETVLQLSGATRVEVARETAQTIESSAAGFNSSVSFPPVCSSTSSHPPSSCSRSCPQRALRSRGAS